MGRLLRQNRLGDLHIAGLELRLLHADMGQRSLQVGTTNLALAGNKARRVITGCLDDLVILGRRRCGVRSRANGTDDGIGGNTKLVAEALLRKPELQS